MILIKLGIERELNDGEPKINRYRTYAVSELPILPCVGYLSQMVF